MRSTFHSRQDSVPASRLPQPARLAMLAVGVLTLALSACGGGSGGETKKPISTTLDAATAAAAGGQPASAASSAEPAEQASAAASGAEGTQAKAAADTAHATAAAAKPATTTTAPEGGKTSSTGATASTTGGGATGGATAPTIVTGGGALATVSPMAATTGTATTSTTTSSTAANSTTSATTSQPCSYEAKTSFANSCSAFMTAVMADGESVTFTNTRPGYAGSVTASCSRGKISWVNATCTATTQGAMQFATATPNTSSAPPDLSRLKVFTARPPFNVATKAGTKRVVLGIYGSKDDVARTHDFVAPLVNPATGRTNVMTLQTTALINKVPAFTNISDISSPPAAKVDTGGRYGLDSQGQLRVAYLANDPPSTEKLRVQVNSWPIPTRQTLTWDLSVRFAGGGAGETWPLTKFSVSPVLIWQLKSDPGFPPMGMMVDVDPENPTKALQLTFFQRLSNVSAYSRRWVVGGIDPNAFNDLIVQAVPDDREPGAGGIGMLKVWLNGKLFVNTTGRNLIPDLPDLNRWCFGLYMVADSTPSPIGRYSTWRRARLLVD